jgi:hypothetical protein
VSVQLPTSGSFDSQARYELWLESLKDRDAALYAELTKRLTERVAKPSIVSEKIKGISLESVAVETGADLRAMVLETIVREGRPAFPIQDGKVNFVGGLQDAAAQTIVQSLTSALPIVEPLIPLVGRIDVDNYPIALPYLGTGWLVDRDLVVTNRHVAELMAREDNGTFKFRPGRLGEPLRVAVDYLHELGSANRKVRRIRRVLWIEKDPGPDIAFIQLEEDSSASGPPAIELAAEDAKSGDPVVVIGYPAKAPADIIPDQEWMDRIYGGVYDIKRIAPGLMGVNSNGAATHDCTTLGGNSGSVVVNMNNGQAVALHFAGLYMIENYAVPASTIKRYLKNPPWQSEAVKSPPTPLTPGPPVIRGGDANGGPPSSNAHEISITIPLKIKVSLGTPEVDQPIKIVSVTTGDQASTSFGSIDDVAHALLREHRVDGVFSVWPGYEIRDGLLTDVECLVVSAHPERVAAVRQAMPDRFANFPVDVRPASLNEQMEAMGVLEAPITSVQYNDDDRTGEGFSFDWVKEEMELLLHVGPERSWVVLSDFFKQTENELISSMYEFHAPYIARAIEQELDEGASLTMVLAAQSRDPKKPKPGDFNRKETFDRWEQTFKKKFDRIFVPLGATGLVANAYHIKVTVADGDKVWLSSGNWKSSSQPLIADADLNNPKATGRAGNREWHVTVKNETLANRFRNHINADFEQCLKLGGTPEALDQQVMVDVAVGLESIQLEAAPAKVLEPLPISRVVRVKPLLTPDKKGAVFCNAVVKLIQSAKKQLVFQNQYIKMSGANSGFLKQLVDALAEKAQQLDDFRIILRSGDLDFDLTQLKRRGIDVNNQVKILDATHTKGIVVDGKSVLIGSHNWSSAGVTLNRDASLIFDDEEIAQYYLEAFEIDWIRARIPRLKEVTTEAVRPAEGDSPAPGFVRMTLADYLEG